MPKIVDAIRNYYRWFRDAPNRRSDIYPRLMSLGQRGRQRNNLSLKAIPGNLRTFARTPCARHAINAIKNPIKDMDWEVIPRKGVTMNSEIRRQIRVVTACLTTPNEDDSFSTFIEKIIEDFLVVSAGAYEQQSADSADHPVYMWPVDGATIQHYAFWVGEGPRYKQVLVQGSDGTGIDLYDDELVYMAPNPTNDTPYGYGPLEITARSISRQLGAAEFAGNVASNSQPLNLIYVGDADNNGITAFRQFWRDEVEGQGSTPLIGGKETPAVLKLAGGDDAGLYLKWQEFLIREIARGFDLSTQSFGLDKEQAKASGSGQAGVTDNRDFKMAVVPMAMKIKDFVTRQTIMKKMGFTQIEFSWPGIDAEDRKKQAEIDEILYQNNMLLPDEARAKRGEPPLGSEFGKISYAEVQIAIGEARRGLGAAENRPGIQHNQSPSQARELTRRH